MASKQTTLSVSSRPGGKPMRKLPTSIDVDSSTTVEDARKLIAKAAGGVDYNRIGIYDLSNNLLKDRKAVLLKQDVVTKGKALLVKDLGAQIPWKMTFVIEYTGPIFFHLIFLLIRPYVYNNPLATFLRLGTVTKKNDQLSEVQYISMVLIVAHFMKRELETLFLHKFSAASMPAYMIVRNSFHYWVSGGAQLALYLYSPLANAAKPMDDTFTKSMVYGGVALFLIGETLNFYCHVVLSRLRTKGGTERGIPQGFSFDWWATSPNYIWEILAWFGVIMVTRSWNTVYFLAWGWYYMQVWSQGKERVYRSEFGSRYKAKTYPLTPGVAFKDSRRKTPGTKKAA